ncbi:MAG: LamG-like jellyroll fold domain-containing protein, partial [Cyclobacteriaceae bacterium]
MKSFYSKITTLTCSLIFLSTALYAQEDCTDGVDNNNDGFIDCYDPLCANSLDCDDFYLGNSVVCQDDPDTSPDFAMRLQWGSDNETADSYATPIVGDLDGNGIPEIVSVNWIQEKMFYLNGATGETIVEIDLGFNPSWQVAIGDVNGDECAWVFVTEYDFNNSYDSYKVRAYDCEGTQVWSRTTSKKYGPGIPGIADFNQDGIPEVYYKDEILNAQTGAVRVAGGKASPGTYSWYYDVAYGTLALDILSSGCNGDCDGLELITGGEIYSVDIDAGTLTLEKSLDDVINAAPYNLTDYEFRYYRTYISAADFNLDGNVDIILSGAVDNNQGNPQTTVFAWDVANDALIGDGYYQDTGNNWSRGTGRINIADLDDDGELNLAYVSGNILYALDEDMNLLWKTGIKEVSSGFTGCTMFDFNGDGRTEIIYRSEESLLVITTDTDGNPVISGESRACVSRTSEEYPVVADVDGDGASEICVTCVTDDNMSIDGNNYVNTQYSQVRVFEADAGEVWQPSRKVWNQHAYFNVNVNDDLTIPIVQQDHTRIFGNEDCQTGDPIENRALNGFLNQSTYIDETGCPSYVSPDINLAGNISATKSVCPGTNFQVSFDIENTGDADISGQLPVTFYAGDPFDASSVRLNTEIETITNFEVGDVLTVTMDVEGIGGAFTLYISLNDYGDTPGPSFSPQEGLSECPPNDNNIGNVDVEYDGFTINAEKLEDNRKCIDSKPDNGEAVAYFEGTEEGGEQTLWFEDFETNGLGQDASGDQSDTNGDSQWSSTPDGSYNPDFYGVDDTFGNNAFEGEDTGGNWLAGDLEWESEVIDISAYTDVTITADLLSNDNCEFSGKSKDRIRMYYNLDGAGYELFTGTNTGTGSFNYTQASNGAVNGSTLQIRCLIHTSRDNEIMAVDNVRVKGTAPTVTKQFTEADGYEFLWYDPTDINPGQELYTGSSLSNMTEGEYVVVGFASEANCYSDTTDVIEILRVTPTFNIWAYTLTPLTNCQNPNGDISAFVYTELNGDGNPVDTLTNGYNFEWISQDGITVVGVGATLEDVDAIPFTVNVSQDLTGCIRSLATPITVTDLTDDFDISGLNVAITHVTSCGGTGDLTATIDGSTNGYDFYWYDGGTLKPTEDEITNDGNPTYSGVSVGQYTLRIVDSSGCGSEPIVYEVENQTTQPTPTITEDAPNSSCDSYNGIISADGDGAGTVSGYTFTWYAGNGVVANNLLPGSISGSSISADGSTVSNLPEGPYTVVVERDGCSVTITGNLTQDFVEPEFSLKTPVDTEESIILASTGYVELPQLFGAGNPVTDGLTISYWANLSVDNYNNDEREFSSGSTGEGQVLLWSDNHNGLAFVVKTQGDGSRGRINSGYSASGWAQIAGTWDAASGEMKLYVNAVEIGSTTYSGTGVLIDTGNPMYIGRDGNIGQKKFKGEIDEVRIYDKALSQTELFQQLCGELDGSEDGLVAYYNFNNIGSTASETDVPDLTGNGHTGKLKNGGANISFPTADITCPESGVTNNTSCDPANPNGSVDISNAVSPAGDYEYSIYDGFTTDGADLVETNSTGVFEGLAEGFYTLTAESTASSCITVPSTVSISTVEDIPSIAYSTTDDANCNSTGTGTISITSASVSGEPGTGYLYEIFDGATNDPGAEITAKSDITVLDGTTGHTFEDLEDGTYRIRVTNNELTCQSYEDIIVGDSSVDPTISSITVAPNTNCSSPSGSFNVEMPGDDAADYTYVWYAGATTSATVIGGETGEILSGVSSTSPSATGQYTVVATEIATGCTSDPVTKTMTDDPFYPALSIDEVQANTGCSGGTSNGIAEAYSDDGFGGSTTLGYTVEWFSDSGLTTPVASTDDGTTNEASGLSSGITYYVRITDDATGCSSTDNINISQTPIYPVISLDNKSPNVSCDPTASDGPTGAATIAVSYDGSPVADLSGYTFTWYEGSGSGGQNITTSGTSNGITAAGEDSETLSGIIDSTYTVVAVGPEGCESNVLNVIINYTPTQPTATATSVKNNTVCDEALAGGFDGSITVTPDTGVPGDYSFEWFEGSGTGGSVINTNTTITSTSASVFKLEGDKNYTLLITDLGSGCYNTYTYFIDNIPAQPIIVPSESTITDVTTCGPDPNGSVVAAIDLAGAELNGRSNDEIWQTFSTCNTEILDDATEVGTNGFQLTTETNNQFGRIWLGDSVDLSQPLRLDFRILLGSKDGSGADGIAFTMHRDPRGYDARGRVGGNLGVGEANGSPGSEDKIDPSLTIEFDTWRNGDGNDPTYDHTNLFFNGDIKTSELFPGETSNLTTLLPSIEDGLTNSEHGDTLNVSIIVTQSGSDQVLELWVNESQRFTYTGNIIDDVFGGETDVIAGFTSSTGGANNNQAVFLQPNFGEYNFSWVDSSNNPVGGNDPFICGVDAGDYTLTVTHSVTGCVSDTETFTIGNGITAIDASITVNQEPTVCSGGTGNGEITAVVNNADTGPYEFKWYEGSGTGGTLIETDTTTSGGTDALTGLDPGTYTVLITDLFNPNDACYNTAEVTLTPNTPSVVVSGTENGATNCNTLDDGFFEVTGITEDYGSGAVAGNVADYEFDLYDNGGNFIVTETSTTINDVNGLATGSYSIVPRNTTTNCEFGSKGFTIGDSSVDPTATEDATGTNDNEVCDPDLTSPSVLYGGQITATVTGSAGNYTFTWY